MVIYEQYMRSNAWSKKREARLKIDKFKCRLCDHDGSIYSLEVHHSPSAYAKIPNESIKDDLTTLCQECHDLITNKIRGVRYSKRVIVIDEFNEIGLNLKTNGCETNGRTKNKNIQIKEYMPDADALRRVG